MRNTLASGVLPHGLAGPAAARWQPATSRQRPTGGGTSATKGPRAIIKTAGMVIFLDPRQGASLERRAGARLSNKTSRTLPPGVSVPGTAPSTRVLECQSGGSSSQVPASQLISVCSAPSDERPFPRASFSRTIRASVSRCRSKNAAAVTRTSDLGCLNRAIAHHVRGHLAS